MSPIKSKRKKVSKSFSVKDWDDAREVTDKGSHFEPEKLLAGIEQNESREEKKNPLCQPIGNS